MTGLLTVNIALQRLYQILFFLLPVSATAYINNTPAKGMPGVSHDHLVFVENKGQITDQHGLARTDVDYKLNAPGLNVFIGKGQVHYQWQKQTIADALSAIPASGNIETYRLDVNLVGANTQAQVIALEDVAYYETYYLPGQAKGIAGHGCKKIIYKDIYPAIDWVLYISNNSLKYDFIVHKNGKVSDIRLQYLGAKNIETQQGNIIVTTPFGSITETAPYCYEAKTRKKVNAAFSLHDNMLGFDIGNYNGDLVIDPQLDWATYYGGSGGEGGWSLIVSSILSATGGCALDATGNVYITNSTNSADNIATAGAFQNVFSSVCGFIAGFNAVGTRLWGTYYGGTALYKIKTGADDKLYVCGIATSKFVSMPPVSHQDTSGGMNDGFLACFNTAGQRLWATFYGGDNEDYALDVNTDVNNDVYIAGYTNSKMGIATPGAFQDTLLVKNNAYIAKFNNAGQRIWATYYPSDTRTNLVSIVTDRNGEVYLAGSTDSSDKIVTAGSHQVQPGGKQDIFFARFDSAGHRVWGTYFGGSDMDYVCGIACDSVNDIYFSGLSYSNNKIAKLPAYQDTLTAPLNAFVAKFSPAGVQQWGTYYPADNFASVYIDKYQDVNLAGVSRAATNVATGGAWQMANNGDGDGVFVKFNKSGQRLWATNYGGSKLDIFNAIVADKAGNVYLSGISESTSGIATAGSHQTTHGGGFYDAVLLRAKVDSMLYVQQPFYDTGICLTATGATIQVGYIVSRTFNTGNIFKVELSDAGGSFASPVVIGTASGTASGYINCVIAPATAQGAGYRIRITSSSPAMVSADNGINIEIRPKPEKPVVSGDTVLCEGQQLKLFASTATPGLNYKWTGSNGFESSLQNATRDSVKLADSGNYIVTITPYRCGISDTLHLRVKPLPLRPTITHNAPVCEGDTLRFGYAADTSGVFYSFAWPNPNVFPQPSNVIDKATLAFSGLYTVVANKDNCIITDTATIYIKPAPVIAASSNSPVTEGTSLTLFAGTDSTKNISYAWTGPDSFSSNLRNPVIAPVSLKASGTYSLQATENGCRSNGITIVIVKESGVYTYTLFPNPGKGVFTIKGNVAFDQEVPINIYSAGGALIWKDATKTTDRKLNKTISLNPVPAGGDYYLKMRVNGKQVVIPFAIVP